MGEHSALDLKAPTIREVLPGQPDGLLPASALKSELTISVPMWDNLPPANAHDTLMFEWRRQNTTDPFLLLKEYTINGPLSVADFPLSLVIEASKFDGFEGVFQFRYGVSTYNGGTIDYSAIVPLVIDRTPPYGSDYPEQLVADTLQITDAYFESAGNLFFCQIPNYSDRGEGDQVAYYWVANELPDDVSLLQPIDVIDVPSTMKLVFTRSQIEAVGNHTCYAVYVLLDKAGNPSRIGASAAIEVTLVDPGLPYPQVLEASGSGSTSTLVVINAADGVTIKVPKEAVILDGETLKASWGERNKPGFFEGVIAVQPEDKRVLAVPKEYIPQQMGHSIPVRYSVKTLVGNNTLSQLLTVNVSMVPGKQMPYGQCASTSVSFASYPDTGLEVKLVTRWFLIMPGQHVCIWAAGVPAARADARFKILDNVEVTAAHIEAGFITATMTKEQVSAFKVPSEFKILTSYSFDGGITWIDENDSPSFTMSLLK